MLKSPLLPIFLIVSVDVLGLTIILPLLPFYAEHYGASPAVVGLLVSLYALCQLIAGPMLGRLSDHMGRRPLLLVSQVGTFIGFLILAYAHALWLIFLSRAIDGITAGNLSLAQAYISDVTKPEDRAKSFALIGIAFGMGFLIGPGLSGFLSKFGYQYPIFVAAGLSATSILATYFLLARSYSAPRRTTPRRASSRFWTGAIMSATFASPAWRRCCGNFSPSRSPSRCSCPVSRSLPSGATRGTASPSGRSRSGYVYAFLGLLGVILQGGLIGRLVKAFGESKSCASRILLWVGRAGGARVHALDSAAAGHRRGCIVRHGNHSSHGNQHDHAEGGAVGTRRDSGPDAVAQLHLGDRGAGAGGFPDRSFAVVDVGGGRGVICGIALLF